MEHIDITSAKVDRKHIGGRELEVPQHKDFLTLAVDDTFGDARIADLDYIVEADLLEVKLVEEEDGAGRTKIDVYVPRRGVLWMETEE